MQLDDESTFLFVGGELAASNKTWILREGVGAVLNCTSNIPNFFQPNEKDEGEDKEGK